MSVAGQKIIQGLKEAKRHRLKRDGIDPDSGEPVRATGWRNLLFSNNGKQYRGFYVWPSEAEAKSVSDEADKQGDNDLHAGKNRPHCTLDGNLYHADYSGVTIQLPVRT